MKLKHLHALFAIVMAACMLTSCRSDLNLSTVDTSMEAHLGLAIPVGTATLTFGNLLKVDSNTFVTIDTIGNQGVLSFNVQPDPDTTRKFSIFDFNGKLQPAEFDFNIYEQLKDVKYKVTLPIIGDTMIPLIGIAESYGISFDTLYLPEFVPSIDSTMVFTLKVPLNGINKGGNERVDSILFNNANFSVTIDKNDFEGLTTEWIDSITVTLGENFNMHGQSNERILHDPSRPPLYFGKELPIDLDNMSLQLMKNPAGKPSMANVVDSIELSARIKYHVPSGSKMVIHKNSGISCKFEIGDLDPVALWGWFTPYKDMYDDGEFLLNINFDELPFLSDPATVLPFSRPELEATVRTQIAGVIKMDGDYMSAVDKNGVEHFAYFGNDPDDHKFEHTFPKSECIDPALFSTLYDTTNLHIKFDKEFGHIHRLFEGGIPTKVKYKFLFSFDSTQTPQIRIPMSTFVHLYSKVKLPFTFQKGFHLEYSDYAENLDISQFDIDSLLGETVQLGDSSQLGIIMKTQSTVPLHVKLVFNCLDEWGNVLKDPEDSTGVKDFTIFDGDTLDIYPPIVTQSPDDNWIFEPREQKNEAHLTKKQMQVFPKTKTLRYKMIIDDSALEEAYESGLHDVPIGKDGQIKLTIGLTAQIDAALNLLDSYKQ